MVLLARLHCSRAPLWVLDEPFTAIDAKGIAALEAKLMEHTGAGGMVVLTTHQALTIASVKVVDLSAYRVVANSDTYVGAGRDD